MFTVDQARDAALTFDELFSLGAGPGDSPEEAQISVDDYVSRNWNSPAVDPQRCADTTSDLFVPSKDTGDADAMLTFPYSAVGGSSTPLTQTIRVTSSIEKAKDLLATLKGSVSSCPSFRIASESGTLQVETSLTDVPLNAEGFVNRFTVTSADEDPRRMVEYVMRFGNVLARVGGPAEETLPFAEALSEKFLQADS